MKLGCAGLEFNRLLLDFETGSIIDLHNRPDPQHAPLALPKHLIVPHCRRQIHPESHHRPVLGNRFPRDPLSRLYYTVPPVRVIFSTLVKPTRRVAPNWKASISAIVKCEVEVIVVNSHVFVRVHKIKVQVDGGMVAGGIITGGFVEGRNVKVLDVACSARFYSMYVYPGEKKAEYKRDYKVDHHTKETYHHTAAAAKPIRHRV